MFLQIIFLNYYLELSFKNTISKTDMVVCRKYMYIDFINFTMTEASLSLS